MKLKNKFKHIEYYAKVNTPIGIDTTQILLVFINHNSQLSTLADMLDKDISYNLNGFSAALEPANCAILELSVTMYTNIEDTLCKIEDCCESLYRG